MSRSRTTGTRINKGVNPVQSDVVLTNWKTIRTLRTRQWFVREDKQMHHAVLTRQLGWVLVSFI